MCHSIVLCESCNKCHECCFKSTCRDKTSKLLASLAKSGRQPKSGSNPERGLHPTIPDPPKTNKISHCRELLCKSPQEQLPAGGIASAYRQKCSRTSTKPEIPGLLQPTVLSPKAKRQMETHTRSKQTQSFPQGGKIQDGDTGDHQNLPSNRGMGNLDRFQRCLLPYPHTGTIQEISKISYPRSDLPIQSTALRSVHSSLGVHCYSKGGETDGHSQGYKNPPVPRRLVGESHIPPGLSPAYSGPSKDVQRTRLAGELGEIRTGAQANLRFCRLPVRPQSWPGLAHTGPVAKSTGQNTGNIVSTGLSGPAVHVFDRFANSHRKTSSSRPATHETYTMASQKQLENTGITGKSDTYPHLSTSSLTVVAEKEGWGVKRRVGRSLKRAHCKRNLVSTRKQAAHKLSRTKSSFCSSKRVSRPLHRPDCLGGDRQYHGGVAYKQGGRYEVGPTMCPTMENLDLVYQKTSDSQSLTHTRPAKCISRQAIQIGPDHSDRMVPPSRGIRGNMQQVASPSDRSICHQLQQQTASICVPNARSPGHSCGRTQPVVGRSGCIRLPTNSHPGQSGGEITGHPMQETYPHCPGVAQHAMVLGPSVHVQPDPTVPAQPTQSLNTALQSDFPQESDKPKSPCVAPRTTAIKEQGFSEAVAARIEAPQRGSTRSVYEAKWAIFTKWCRSNKVDFRAPPVKSVTDFLMYLFQDRKLQPSTIDGYRSAIADKLGNSSLNISKDENLTRLLDSFHRDRPKGRRSIPSWNLSLVLHQLSPLLNHSKRPP